MASRQAEFGSLSRRAEMVLARSASLTGKKDAAPMQRGPEGALQPLARKIDELEQVLVKMQIALGADRLKHLLAREASDLKGELRRERAEGDVAVRAVVTPVLTQLPHSFVNTPKESFQKKDTPRNKTPPPDRRGQLRAIDDTIATTLLELRHTNLFQEATGRLVAVAKEDFGRRVIAEDLPISRLCAAYQQGREIERRQGLSLCSCYMPHPSDAPDEALEFQLLAEPAPSIEQDMQRRHLARSKEHAWTLAVQSEVLVHLSLYNRFFIAHLLTLIDGATTAEIVRIDVASVVRKVQACIQELLANLTCSWREVILCISIYCSCGRIPSDDFAAIYEAAHPALETLFTTLSLAQDSLGFRLLQTTFQRGVFMTLTQVLEEAQDGMSLDAAIRQARQVSFRSVTDALSSWMQAEILSADKLSRHFFLYRYDDKTTDSGVRASLDTLLAHAIPGLSAALRHLYRIPRPVDELGEHRSDVSISSEELYRHLSLLDTLSSDAYFPEFLVSLDDLEGYVRREKEAAARDLDLIKERIQRLERQLRRDFPSVMTDGEGPAGRVYATCRTWKSALATSDELLILAAISTIALYVHNYLLRAMNITDEQRGSWLSNTHSLDAVLDELLRLAEEHGVSGLLESTLTPRKYEHVKQGYREASRKVKEAEKTLSEALVRLNKAGMMRGLLEDALVLEDADSQAPRRIATLTDDYQELFTNLSPTPSLPAFETTWLERSPQDLLESPLLDSSRLLTEFDTSLAKCLEEVVRELDALQPHESSPALALTRRVDLVLSEVLGTASLFGLQSHLVQNEYDELGRGHGGQV